MSNVKMFFIVLVAAFIATALVFVFGWKYVQKNVPLFKILNP